jgi:hypothetical protein
MKSLTGLTMASSFVFSTLLSAAVMASAVPAQSTHVKATNSAHYLGNGAWSWTVFLQGDRSVLSSIRCVEYRLHPTFPNPVRRVCALGSIDRPFALTTQGWGEFEIQIKVTFARGPTDSFSYPLRLRESFLPSTTLQNPAAVPANSTMRISERTIQGRVRYHITEPVVSKSAIEIPSIQFRPGDKVRIDADGCANTGGTGKTWKRFVNPSGPNAERMYYGLIQLPSRENDTLQKMQNVIGRTITITDAGTLVIGYEDDDYHDNGYDGRNNDNGTDEQCRGLGNAFIDVTVNR